MVGAILNNLRQERANAIRPPAKTEWQMHDMHTQIAHTAVFTVGSDDPLPVDRLVRIKVAAVPKPCLYFDNISEPPFFDPFNNPHSTWEKRKFRRASDDNVRVILNGLKDLLIRFKIDAKGLFS